MLHSFLRRLGFDAYSEPVPYRPGDRFLDVQVAGYAVGAQRWRYLDAIVGRRRYMLGVRVG